MITYIWAHKSQRRAHVIHNVVVDCEFAHVFSPGLLRLKQVTGRCLLWAKIRLRSGIPVNTPRN